MRYSKLQNNHGVQIIVHAEKKNHENECDGRNNYVEEDI